MKKIKILFIIALISVISSSCDKDFLNLTPTETVSDDKAFATPDAAKGVINSIYDQLSYYWSTTLTATITNEVRGDDMFITQFNNWTWWVPQFNYNVTADSDDLRDGIGMWREYYQTIRMCNAFLSAELPFSEAETNKLSAEVKTIQAYSYFYLVQLYSAPYTKDNGASPGVPLRLTTDVTLPMGRGTVSEVYDLIFEILKFATQHLDPIGNASGGSIFMSKCFADGLLARVYMTMGKYAEALPYVNAALADAPPLATGSEYTAGFSHDNPESIFRLGFTSNTDFTYRTLQSFSDYGWGDAGGYGTMCVYDDFWDNYAANDLRQEFFGWKAPYSWNALRDFIDAKGDDRAYSVPFYISGYSMNADVIDPSGEIIYSKEGRQLYPKFPRRDDDRNAGRHDSGEIGYADFTVMRTSELYLIKAECEARGGSESSAQAALFTVQGRSIPSAVMTSNGGQALIEEIWLERRKEFLGEGFRLLDILRNGLALNRPSSTWSEVTSLTSYDPRFILPIPQAEIDANEGLTDADQNPGY